MKLSPRLQKLAGYVPIGARVLDVGTDHALLPIFLVSKGISPFIVAGDLHEGPYEAAKKAVKNAGLSGKIDVRLGNGLETVCPGEVDVIIIAGMGGQNIRDILSAHPKTVEKTERLILQPMLAAYQVREWLYGNGWVIVDEELVEEDDRIYEIIVAQKGYEELQDPFLNYIGPRLVEKKHPLLRVHLRKMLQREENILEGLMKSRCRDREREEILIKKIDGLKRLISWLNVKQ